MLVKLYSVVRFQHRIHFSITSQGKIFDDGPNKTHKSLNYLLVTVMDIDCIARNKLRIHKLLIFLIGDFIKVPEQQYFNLVDGTSVLSQKVWENQIFYYNEF